MKHFIYLTIVLFASSCQKPYQLLADITPPGEVENLTYIAEDIDLKLTWKAPSDEDLIGFVLSLHDANNQQQLQFKNLPIDSTDFTFKKLAPGQYYATIRTRDKENNLSEGSIIDFSFLSKAPVNVRRISASVHWNSIHIDWDSLRTEDFTTRVGDEEIQIPVDSIIVEVDSAFQRFVLPVTATGIVIPHLPDGQYFINVYTHGESGFYSSEYKQTLPKINFSEKFVRVEGDGHDFYMARYEVTTEEYRKFIVDDLQLSESRAPYPVSNQRVEADAWYKWWYGADPSTPNVMYLLGFNTWEFELSPSGWFARRYPETHSFGRATWEGAMLYALVNYNGRLPTAEEWLYAARGGSESMGYDYAGSNDPDEVGWWGWAGGEIFLHAPGQKKPNELGIYDLSGNASEMLYELDDNGSASLGKVKIIGGSSGPIHFWGNEGEDFGPDNTLKPKLSSNEIIKSTGLPQRDAFWRTGIRVVIPAEELEKKPFNRFKYER